MGGGVGVGVGVVLAGLGDVGGDDEVDVSLFSIPKKRQNKKKELIIDIPIPVIILENLSVL